MALSVWQILAEKHVEPLGPRESRLSVPFLEIAV